MFVVFITTEDLVPPTSKKTQVNRSYSSKETILAEFLKNRKQGELTTDPAKLTHYKNQIVGSDILAVNRCGSHCDTLEVLHSDQVKEV